MSLKDIKPNALSNHLIIDYASKNEPGTVKLPSPILVIQGDMDITIPSFTTKMLVQKMQELGTDVTYKVYPEQDHIGALRKGVTNGDILKFIQTNMPSK